MMGCVVFLIHKYRATCSALMAATTVGERHAPINTRQDLHSQVTRLLAASVTPELTSFDMSTSRLRCLC